MSHKWINGQLHTQVPNPFMTQPIMTQPAHLPHLLQATNKQLIYSHNTSYANC